MITLCGVPVQDGDRLVTTTEDPVVVVGHRLRSVKSGGSSWHRVRREWRPPGKVRHKLEHSSGETVLHIVDDSGVAMRVVLVRETVKLTAEQIQALRESLGELALSFQDEAVVTDVAVAGVVGERTTRGQAGWWRLYEVLSRHLPPLLTNPLRTQQLAVGPTPLSRAGLTPGTILARLTRGERSQVLAFRSETTESPADYRWLAGVVGGVLEYARRRARARQRIAFEGEDEVTERWIVAATQLRRWLAHPTLGRHGSGTARPTWTLTRHAHGSRIVRAAGATLLASQLASGARGHDRTTRRLMRAPVAEDAHLYELWIVLSVVEVLRDNFNLQFLDGEPQRFHDYGEYDEVHQRWALRPMRLFRECPGLDGEALRVDVTVHHGPTLKAGSRGKRTPDLVLDVDIGGRKTRHGLDAKFIKGSPLSAARDVAKKWYLDVTELHTCFLAIPSARADLGEVMTAIDRGHRGRGYPGWAQEDYAVSDDPRYGVAWGTVAARPGDLQYGVRQFVALALQYHRTELRHLCGQCGHALTLEHVSGAWSADAALAAHHDQPMGDQPVSPVRLDYQCPSCSYEWSRHRCYHGHVLMKHGRLTPHRQLDGDHNVACSACGHRVKRNP